MRKNLLSQISLCIFMVITSTLLVRTASAQGNSTWKPAKEIPFYDDIYPPHLVADQNRTVHSFNSQQLEGKTTILYRQWQYNTGWSKPIAILEVNAQIPANQSLRGVTLDQKGQFHLIYLSGSAEDGSLYYTNSWAIGANSSKNWSKPLEIASNTGPLAYATLIGDGIENLYIVYLGKIDGTGLYEIHSSDSGETWSRPRALTLIRDLELIPYYIQLELSPEGTVHAVWSLKNPDGIGEAVYYAKREAGSFYWSEPILIAAREGNDYAADWPSIKYFEDELFLIYYDGVIPGGVPPTRWMRKSIDNGDTWSPPIRPFPHVGENGFAVMLLDSNEKLHIVLANRVGDPAIGGVWHGVWLGQTWSKLELITPKTSAEAVATGSYADIGNASRPNAIISQGNILLVTWWHDMQDGPPAGYSYISLDTPEMPIESLPVPDLSLTPTSLPQSQPKATTTEQSPTETAVIAVGENNPAKIISPTTPILLSLISAIILIIGIFIFRRLINL